jgi:phosphatidylserine/phosphatidylglycerophosphate/cardiolipin synthase-like enzyme
VSFAPNLHTKLYCAETTDTSFAMFGSANFTQRSLVNRELGVMVSARGDGAAVVRALFYEAADIYRVSPGRELWCRASLGGT